MDRQRESAQAHVVPSYRASSDAHWFHFLHGNVPGHQIDFMFRAEVPQGPLTRQHFSHLSRIMKYIEPQASAPYAFAIANLSRDDTQYEPGRGGLAMIFGHRVQGTRDHAGRQDPPFAHGIAAVNREFTTASLRSVALSFYRSVLGGEPTHNGPSSLMYREYVRCLFEASHGAPDVLRAYLSGFSDLPRPPESSLSLRWLTSGAPQPSRVVVVHPDEAPFSAVAECASRIAGVLYQSDIRWTSITSGRELEVANGVTIRLVARRDASSYSSEGRVILMSEVPEEEPGIAKVLFNAAPLVVRSYSTAPAESWKRQPRRAIGSSAGTDQTASSSRSADEHTAGPEAPREVERARPSETLAETSAGPIESDVTSGDKPNAPSNAEADASVEATPVDECLTTALTAVASPFQGAPSAPSEPEPSTAAYDDRRTVKSDVDDDDLRAFVAPRRPRVWLYISMALGGATALPLLYASWGGLSLGDGASIERSSSSSEPAQLVSRAEPSEPAGPARSGPAATSNAASKAKGDVSKPTTARQPTQVGRFGKGSTAKPPSMSSSSQPPLSPPPAAPPPSAGPSIIGAPPVFASTADGKQ